MLEYLRIFNFQKSQNEATRIMISSRGKVEVPEFLRERVRVSVDTVLSQPTKTISLRVANKFCRKLTNRKEQAFSGRIGFRSFI